MSVVDGSLSDACEESVVTGSSRCVDGVQKATVKIDIQDSTVSVRYDPVPVFTVEFSPNPARDRLRVVFSSTGIGEGVGVRLYDMQGRDVLGGAVPFDESGRVEIHVSDLPTGTYRAVVEGEDRRVIAVRTVMIVR